MVSNSTVYYQLGPAPHGKLMMSGLCVHFFAVRDNDAASRENLRFRTSLQDPLLFLLLCFVPVRVAFDLPSKAPSKAPGVGMCTCPIRQFVASNHVAVSYKERTELTRSRGRENDTGPWLAGFFIIQFA